jgi:hypothetical protein
VLEAPKELLVSRGQFDRLHLALVQTAARIGLLASYPSETACMFPVWDDVLTRQFTDLKRSGVSTQTFAETHFAMLTLLLSALDLRAVLDAQGDWLSARGPLSRLTSQWQVARTMFGFTRDELEIQQFTEGLQEALRVLELREASYVAWFAQLGTLLRSNTDAVAGTLMHRVRYVISQCAVLEGVINNSRSTRTPAIAREWFEREVNRGLFWWPPHNLASDQAVALAGEVDFTDSEAGSEDDDL